VAHSQTPAPRAGEHPDHPRRSQAHPGPKGAHQPPEPRGQGAPAVDGATGYGSAPGAPPTGRDETARIAQLEDELAAAKAEAAANWDKYLRERAEMENFKRRVERTSGDQMRRERKELLLKFLGVLDNLERALSYQRASGEEVDVQGLLTGLRLTESQFRDLLANAGVTAVPAVGEAFDPALHEAVATAVTADVPEGQIVDELQKGYRYGDELLRPARVRVATGAAGG
jgi:molecular chaperone GrpE